MTTASDPAPHHKRFGGLAVTLFLWFLALSITPVVFVGVNEYQMGRDEIVKDRYDQLTTINFQITERISEFVESVRTNLAIIAKPSTLFLTQLQQEPEQYDALKAEYVTRYGNVLTYYHYKDILLIDAAGNIVFTVSQGEDLGANLGDIQWAGTELGRSVMATLRDGEPRYVDLDQFRLTDTQSSIFITQPVKGDDGHIMGVVAIQIYRSEIQNLFEIRGLNINGLSSYLVGQDHRIRFGSQEVDGALGILSPNNPLMQLWLEHLSVEGGYVAEVAHDAHPHDDHEVEGIDRLFEQDSHNDVEFGILHDSFMSHIRVYDHGEKMLGVFLPINIVGTEMMMLSEVNYDFAFVSVNEFRTRLLWLLAITFVLVTVIAFFVARSLVKPLGVINAWVNRVAAGDYTDDVHIRGRHEIAQLSRSFAQMIAKLRNISEDNARRNWQQEGITGLYNSVRGEQSIAELCENIVTYLARYLDMHSGAMFVLESNNVLALSGSYAWTKRKQTNNRFELGEGLVGQVGLEKKTIELTHVPEDFLQIESGMGVAVPSFVIIIPLVYEDQLKGVIELSSLGELGDDQRRFLQLCVESIAIALNSAQYRTRVTQLLETTTAQSTELEAQKAQLHKANSELEQRTTFLEESEEELKAQSDELQKSNAELEELSERLMLQKEEIELKNKDIERSAKNISEKAEELERASKYKSEFLANMSHELRTPLNSLLLLSQMLADNDEGNLTQDQIESAQVIYNGGKELLELINDILDLSKVEAGKMSVNLDHVYLSELEASINALFKPVAQSHDLAFSVVIAEGAPESVFTDSQRLMQILKNLLSNALKFTEEGSVDVLISSETRQGRHQQEQWLRFVVKDTGIGIPEDKQQSIFESFQQADGSTSRQYGGTGLGLAISREMAALLGGFIELESEPGKGTTFTLLIPASAVCSLGGEIDAENDHIPKAQQPVQTDVISNQPRKTSDSELELLIIEDDSSFLEALNQLAHRYPFNVISAKTGADGLMLAKSHQPAAIILDLGLPDMDGEAVLDALQQDPATKDIPIHIISASSAQPHIESAVVGYLHKPVGVKEVKQVFTTLQNNVITNLEEVVLYEPDAAHRQQIVEALSNKGLAVRCTEQQDELEAWIKAGEVPCLILGLDHELDVAIAFLTTLKDHLNDNMPLIVLLLNHPPEPELQTVLATLNTTVIMKGERAFERINDEVSLFLHAINKEVSPAPKPSKQSSSDERELAGHKLLLVDDDLRNTFALSKALQAIGIEVVLADNGKSGIQKLEDDDDIELVLMDVMMPVMDGYEATREIRKIPAYKTLPIIALTAKAMTGDRDKCIEAGASDYMTKPLDMEKLIELLKVWILK